ncbi:Type I secretion outer membrane protein, TolC precursor [Roseibacterium elongatum DSM 19469]|uniref:Type I secretion outer membrane protein, TolC n=2 Tax=Roseicyclus elongatus TaxID=159346 RepID=W8RN77_9RHOB|nr:Type I secretion outer membrane protein, TolC precursor [Roseibacterium elongatum DSM 19469]
MTLAAGAVALAAVPTPAAADSLRQAMADAYANSFLLEQNRYLLRIDDENVAQAMAALRPVLNFVASAERDLVNETTTATAALVAEWVIYQGGGRRAAIQGARETLQATRYELIALEQQVLRDAVTAYMNVWRDIQVVNVRQGNVRVITQQLRAARDRFEVGEDTRTDVAQAEAALAEARSQLAAAQGTLEISRELFNLAIGRYPNGLSGPGHIPGLPRSEAEAEALARQSHPSILALQHEVTAAELAVAEARSAYLPSVTLDGRYSYTEVDPEPFTGNPGEGASIGITLTQPIYRGGQLASFERQALAQAAVVRAGLNQQVLVNVQAVGNAWAQMRIANAQIQAADQQIAASELAFEGVREEASLGARTTLDVLDAEQDVLNARIARIQAQTDLYIASYALLAASGLLTVEHLDLPVPEYDPEAYADLFGRAPARFASPQGAQLDSVLQRVGRSE